VSVEGVEEDDNCFPFDAVRGFPCVGHQFGSMVIPIFVDGEVRDLFDELLTLFFETHDSFELFTPIFGGDAAIVLII
jgi:hypothetical protein